jgi:hypothetical protein
VINGGWGRGLEAKSREILAFSVVKQPESSFFFNRLQVTELFGFGNKPFTPFKELQPGRRVVNKINQLLVENS